MVLEAMQQEQEEAVAAPPVAANLPRQGDAVVAGVQDAERIELQLLEILKPPSEVDYLQVRGGRAAGRAHVPHRSRGAGYCSSGPWVGSSAGGGVECDGGARHTCRGAGACVRSCTAPNLLFRTTACRSSWPSRIMGRG